MNATRLAIVAILGSALLAGAALWYLQVWYYYEEIPAEVANVQLTLSQTGEPEPVAVQHVVRSFDPCMVCTVH